jgi:hypothetical protein
MSSRALPAEIKICMLRVAVRPTALIDRNVLNRLTLIPRDDEVSVFVDHQPSYLQMLFRQRHYYGTYGTIPYLFAFEETAGAVIWYILYAVYVLDAAAIAVKSATIIQTHRGTCSSYIQQPLFSS